MHGATGLADSKVEDRHATELNGEEPVSDEGRRRQFSPAPGQTGKSRPNHLFIHTVRFWSMVAIVGLHSAIVLSGIRSFPKIEIHLIFQISKFGTISFFLISGFLMGERLPSCNPVDYLRRRVSRLFGPWLLWLVVLVTYFKIKDLVQHGSHMSNWHATLVDIDQKATYCLHSTAFWFVPNMIVAMCCLLCLRKWLNDIRIGAGLLAVNLFYVINIYAKWFPSAHTEATFGYVFHLWIGAWCALNFDKVQRFLNRLSTPVVLGCVVLTLLAGLAESGLLYLLHNPDPMNTLRLTNQIFSIVVTLALLRVRRRTWPRFIDVPSQTYGIYLIHSVAMFALVPVLARLVWWPSRTGAAMEWMLISAVTYSVSLLVTMCLGRTPGLEWTVGVQKKRRAPETRLAASPVVHATSRGLSSA